MRNIIFSDETKGEITIPIKRDKGAEAFVRKLIADGYWVRVADLGRNIIGVKIRGADNEKSITA